MPAADKPTPPLRGVDLAGGAGGITLPDMCNLYSHTKPF
jgi:hypothetical protein